MLSLRKKKKAGRGFTIVEMLVSLVIVGISAALLAPKVLNTQGETATQAVILKIDSLKYQMTSNIKLFKSQNNLSDDDMVDQMKMSGSNITFNNIYSMYGNYYAYKQTSGTSPKNYYFLMDRSKLSFDRTFFTTGTYASSNLPDYETANGNYCRVQVATDSGGNPIYVYPCFYIDINGPATPNQFIDAGANGKVNGKDIIPMYVDPETFEVSTLYEATGDCVTYSQYDALTTPFDTAGTSICSTRH